MEKSRTKSATTKKQKTSEEQQQSKLNAATLQIISQWTQRELTRISANGKIPVIWKLDNGGYKIGLSRVEPLDNQCWNLTKLTGETIQFDSKLSAVFYCLMKTVGENNLAEQILYHDKFLLQLKTDIQYYSKSLERSIAAKDSERIHVWGTRYDECKLKIEYHTDLLNKFLTIAKYNKYWE